MARSLASQFLHGEGFGQVVVGPGVQCLDFIPVLAAGADDDDGHLGPGAHLGDHLDAVHVGQSQVKQHNIRLL